MNLKKVLCMAMVMLLTLGAAALAETEDAEARLEAANARIEELEAQVALYKPFYDAQIVAEYGDGGIIWRDDAMAEYQAAASTYSQYGMNIDDYASEIKPSILKSLVQNAVLDAKATELGLDQLDDEARANLEAEATENFETYIETYKSYFASEDASDEEAREQTVEAMAKYGLTQDALTQQLTESYVSEQLHNYATADVAVTDEDVRAKYDELTAYGEEHYGDDRAYNTARNNGDIVAWNPEGYRAVKHVLIKFDDEQSAQYSQLQSTLKSLNAELKALDAPAEATEAAADAEATEAPRTREEIQSDIGRIGAELEALYSQLLPQAQQVIDEFQGGADFDSLIAKYNQDPGMGKEPTATNGYAVSANSTTWDPAFTEGAMSIEAVGGISAPINGQNGVHIIYYLSDITPGAVPFEDVEDAVREAALNEKISAAYTGQVAAWVEEANPVYHVERF